MTSSTRYNATFLKASITDLTQRSRNPLNAIRNSHLKRFCSSFIIIKLHILRYTPGHGFTNNNDEFDGTIHMFDAFGSFFMQEIVRCLLDRDLIGCGFGHARTVIFQTSNKRRRQYNRLQILTSFFFESLYRR